MNRGRKGWNRSKRRNHRSSNDDGIPASLAEKASSAVGYALDDENEGTTRLSRGGGGSTSKRSTKRRKGSSYTNNANRNRSTNAYTYDPKTPNNTNKLKSKLLAEHRDVPRTFRKQGKAKTDENNDNDKTSSSSSSSLAIATPAYISRNADNFTYTPKTSDSGNGGENNNNKNNNNNNSEKNNNSNPMNPYQRDRYAPPSSAKRRTAGSTKSVHVICAISENLARETCIAIMDAGSPATMQVHKLTNGQMYAEIISFLEVKLGMTKDINNDGHFSTVDEILLNEGRRNSILCRKIQTLVNCTRKGTSSEEEVEDTNNHGNENDPHGGNSRQKKQHSNLLPRTKTVLKFLPRTYFDQNKGADLLRRVALESSIQSMSDLQNEYILLSSAHAVLSYIQICLGANFAPGTLAISMDAYWSGGGGDSGSGSGYSNGRLIMDRSTIAHLELLANAKTGKSANSLMGTIDCTKTSVGRRLLRSNLISPPNRRDTIEARLNLVDCFLSEEQFFYEVLEQLLMLPDIDKMLAHMALVPRNASTRTNSANQTKKRQVTARMASKGISALVCIKSALTVIPEFARVLQIQLDYLVGVERTKKKYCRGVDDNSLDHDREGEKDENGCNHDGDGGGDDIDSAVEASLHGNDLKSLSEASDTDREDDEDNPEAEESSVMANSLLIGLGGKAASISGASSLTNDQNQDAQKLQLLRAILATMKNPVLQEILHAVMAIFTESTTYSKNTHAMKHQECFALKPNTDGMMDVLRKAFLANVDDIYKLADEYAETLEFTVNVKETTARGYYLSIPINSIPADFQLPPTFIQPVKTGKFINCTTEEVLSLSSRAQENVQDLLLMTHDRIQEVIDFARQKYDALASLSDAIALLDMCHSFADNVASSQSPWCRPVVTDCAEPGSNAMKGVHHAIAENIVGSGSIAIRNGRYGIDVSKTGLMTPQIGIHKTPEFVPNDTYASAFQNFTVITGVNGSGKSTYLKQLAITVILAHCGSYVPAEEAFVPVHDRICTRIGNADDQEHNISTFMQEMKDTAFICRNATDKSLILIDELGRATSNEDGVAIAWAIAEFLLVKRATTFFVTHYPQLTRLAEVYPNVQNQHLGTIIEEDSGEVRYMHKIMPGSCKMSADYGVEMAAMCGWQIDVVEMVC